MEYTTKRKIYEGMSADELMELIPFDGEEDDELIDAALAAKQRELGLQSKKR